MAPSRGKASPKRKPPAHPVPPKPPAAQPGRRRQTSAALPLPPFCAAVVALRARAGLSQAEVASRAGVSGGYIGLIETGHRGGHASLDVVKRLGGALGASIQDMEQLLLLSGHLEPGESLLPSRDRPTFRKYLKDDPRIADWQRDVLVVIYDSFLGSAPRRKKRLAIGPDDEESIHPPRLA